MESQYELILGDTKNVLKGMRKSRYDIYLTTLLFYEKKL